MFNYFTIANAYAENHNQEFYTATAYGEPGYDEPEKGILLSNWNNWPSSLMKRMKTAGFNLEWSDEWIVHHDRAYRCSPDCYSWEPSYIIWEGEVITIHDDPEEWYDCLSIDDPVQPLIQPIPSHLPRLSHWKYIEEPEYELGFHVNEEQDLLRAIEQLLEEKAEKVAVVRSESSQVYSRFVLAYLPN